MNIHSLSIVITAVLLGSSTVAGAKQESPSKIYADFPVTLKNYSGDKQHSVSYSGQVARHVLHDSLKVISKQGDGQNADAVKAKLTQYYSSKEAGRDIISPVTKEGFVIKQAKVDDISTDKNLEGKTYQGVITGWPGNMTGAEVLKFMLAKAANTSGGYDPLTGYDYTQLISKFVMGAVFYHQAVDNYLDEKLSADNKPNNKPYKKGKHYTGKEHVWDEGFGYFGAPAHALSLTPKQAYAIAKKQPEAFALADFDRDGVVDLKTEMVYAHAYYAAGADKSGKTHYLHTIMEAFIDGRQLISDANGQALTDSQRQQLQAYAATIEKNWEMVIAEAVFKYAGSTYQDLQKLKATVANNGDAAAIFRQYAKHWGELKGFSLALQTGRNNLGETAVKLNRLIGFSPVLLGNTQVSAIDAEGGYVQASSQSLEDYMLHMLKVQKLMVDQFQVKARSNDVLSALADLANKLGTAKHAEND